MNSLKLVLPLASGTEAQPQIRLHSPGYRCYCAPSLYGKAKNDIDPFASKFVFQSSIKGFDELMDDL
jgi:hypothetical protein